MRVSVSSEDPTPPYEQIRFQIAELIDVGSLSAGDRLPTVRQLAGDLRVAPGTVARAYRELEASGHVETRRAAGTRVAGRSSASSESQRRGRLEALLNQTTVRARELGATEEECEAAWRQALSAAFGSRPDEPPAISGGRAVL